MQKDEQQVHWTHRLFVENADLYLPFLEQAKQRALHEATVLSDLFEEFGVPTGGRVLDAACGIGRHGVLMAKRGYRVTGVDLSPLFIEKAREYAKEEGVEADFIVGDALEVEHLLTGTPPFDAIINMFTSHSYYGREGDLKMFGGLRQLASPGAILVVLTANRDCIVKNFSAEGMETAGNVRILQNRRLDLETSTIMNTWEFFERENNHLNIRLKLDMNHRLYSLHELKSLLEEAGWEYLRGYGRRADSESRLGEPSIDSLVMWLVARA